MAASYPSSLPVKDAAGANLSTNPHSTLHDDMYDEIVAIATELGTNPKGTSASVKARLDLLESGAWTSYTPQVDQGTTNISKTVNYGKYTRLGRTITFNFTLTMVNAGTSGQPVQISIPVSASAATAITGSGIIFDTSTSTSYAGVFNASLAGGPVTLRGDWSGTGSWGSQPVLALASGDTIYGSITYEAAS